MLEVGDPCDAAGGLQCPKETCNTGLNLIHGAIFQRFLSGKSVFLNLKFQIREFHAH